MSTRLPGLSTASTLPPPNRLPLAYGAVALAEVSTWRLPMMSMNALTAGDWCWRDLPSMVSIPLLSLRTVFAVVLRRGAPRRPRSSVLRSRLLVLPLVLRPPLRAHPMPFGQSLGDDALVAVAGGPVQPLRLHLFGEVVRPRESSRRVRIVLVALPVAEILHQLRRGVEDVRRRHEGTGRLRQPLRGVERRVDRDGLRGGCEIDDGLGDRELTLRRPEPLVDVPCRRGLVDGLRV